MKLFCHTLNFFCSLPFLWLADMMLALALQPRLSGLCLTKKKKKMKNFRWKKHTYNNNNNNKDKTKQKTGEFSLPHGLREKIQQYTEAQIY